MSKQLYTLIARADTLERKLAGSAFEVGKAKRQSVVQSELRRMTAAMRVRALAPLNGNKPIEDLLQAIANGDEISTEKNGNVAIAKSTAKCEPKKGAAARKPHTLGEKPKEAAEKGKLTDDERAYILDALLDDIPVDADSPEAALLSGAESNGKKRQLSKEVLSEKLRVFYKVVRPSVFTGGFSTAGSGQQRRLIVGETVELVEQAKGDNGKGVTRIHARALKDGEQGWVTTMGTQGTAYLEVGGTVFKVAITTRLSKGPSPESGEAVRETNEGELLVLSDWARPKLPKAHEDDDDLPVITEMKLKAQEDGAVGWAKMTEETAIGISRALLEAI